MATTPEFTTIRIADILDALCDAVDTARVAAGDNAAWQNAITAAWDYLLVQDTIAYDIPNHAIRVESATRAGRVYEANGDCQCEAFTKGNGVCWHRAAARLVRRALELIDLASEITEECATVDGYTPSPAEARHSAKREIGILAGVASDWDAMATAAKALIGRAQAAAMAQIEADELFPPRVAA